MDPPIFTTTACSAEASSSEPSKFHHRSAKKRAKGPRAQQAGAPQRLDHTTIHSRAAYHGGHGRGGYPHGCDILSPQVTLFDSALLQYGYGLGGTGFRHPVQSNPTPASRSCHRRSALLRPHGLRIPHRFPPQRCLPHLCP
jgi:hypothetical protein